MIFLYILLAVVLIIALILMINLRISVKYGDKTYVKVGALFFDYDYIKKQNKKSQRKKKKTAKSGGKSAKDKKKNVLSEFTDGLEFSDFLQLLRLLIIRMVESSSGHVRVRIKRLEVTVGGEKPDTTALLFGGINAAVSWILEYLSLNTRLYPPKKSSIFVNCDFDKGKTEAELELTARIRIIHLVKFALKFFVDFIKLKEYKNNTSLKGTK